MKKRFIAIMLAALMAVCAVPISAMAADALAFTDSTGINTNHYSFTLYNGDDYIANVLEGADKNKTQTVEKGVVCFKRLIHHDMSKSLKTYKATKQKGDPHEQTENNRPV